MLFSYSFFCGKKIRIGKNWRKNFPYQVAIKSVQKKSVNTF